MNLPGFMTRGRRNQWPEMTLDSYINQVYGSFGFQGQQYPILMGSSLGVNPVEEPPNNYYGYVGYLQNAYRANGVVFACVLARMMHFAEVAMMGQEINDGRPGALVDFPDLNILRHPWPKGNTGDLLSRALLDVDLAGNSFAARRKGQLYRLRPDWTTIIMGSNTDPDTPSSAWDAEVIGYYYCSPHDRDSEMAFLASEVAHWAPVPDPTAKFRGSSWLTAIMKEMMADNAMTYHQRKYFEQGATPNIVVSFDPRVNDTSFKRWVQLLRDETEGVENAYRTMWLGGGAEPHVVGARLEDFREVKGHGETRIAAAAGVPPIIVGLSEGLDSATYSNYGQARRHFGDSTLRYLWRTFVESIEDIIDVPPGVKLWYDLRDVAFMREDENDAAQIQHTQANTIRILTDGGWEPDSVVKAVLARDWSLLVPTGLLSVQLQPPGTQFKPTKPKPAELPAGANGLMLPTQAELAQILARHNGNGRGH